MTIKNLLILNHFGWENYEINVHLYRFYCTISVPTHSPIHLVLGSFLLGVRWQVAIHLSIVPRLRIHFAMCNSLLCLQGLVLSQTKGKLNPFISEDRTLLLSLCTYSGFRAMWLHQNWNSLARHYIPVF